MARRTEYYGEYYKLIADALVNQLESNTLIRKLTVNSSLIGSYAESTVRSITERMVSPLRVSTGSITSPELFAEHELSTSYKDKSGVLKQLDLIVWSPTPFPSLFDENGFALVSQYGVKGSIEIKRSCYSGVGKKIQEKLDWVEDNIPGMQEPNVLADETVTHYVDSYWKALGVICLQEKDQTIDPELQSLIYRGRAVILLKESAEGVIEVNTSHVFHFVDFLSKCRRRSHSMESDYRVNVETISKWSKTEAPGSLKNDNIFPTLSAVSDDKE